MMIKKIFIGNSLFLNLLYTIIYISLFSYVWKSYCVPVWHAFYYKDIPHSFSYDLIGYFIALFPIFFYRGIKNTSSWICLILYFFGYVPIILGLLFNFPELNNYNVIEYWIVLCVSMSLFFYSDRLNIKIKSFKNKVSINTFWVAISIIFLIQLAIYHKNMRIVDFMSIYDLRAENAALGSGIINYLNSWSSSFFYPLLFIYGLFTKNRLFIILGFLSFIFLYSIFGSKSDLFTPVILFGFYKFYLWQEEKDINLISIFTLGITFLSLLLLSNLENEAFYLFAAIFLMRTLTISGVLFAGWYLPFFQNNPHTYFAHVNIINEITNLNPYHGQAIGKVVSEGGMNANAIFWAMDGITAMGLVGVIIVSLFFLFFLLFINGISTNSNRIFLSMLMLVPTIALLNTSFFTFLLSEGVFFIFILFFFVDLNLIKRQN